MDTERNQRHIKVMLEGKKYSYYSIPFTRKPNHKMYRFIVKLYQINKWF